MNKFTKYAIIITVAIGASFLLFLNVAHANPCKDVELNIHLATRNPATIEMKTCQKTKEGDNEVRKGSFYSQNDFGVKKMSTFYCVKKEYYSCKFY